MNDKGILVIGELNIDLILNSIQGFPAIGEEILANEFNVTMGSSSAIFASNISILGVDTTFCGMVGRDSFGQFICEELRRKNVNTTHIVESERYKTGITVVLNYDQNRANVTYCGAMEMFNKTNVPVHRFADFKHLHISSYFLQKGIQKEIPNLFKLAKDNGLSTSLDIQWDPENKWKFPYQDCLPYVDVFLPNENELLMLSGKPTIGEALMLVGEFGNKIVVKQGVKGSTCYESGRREFCPAFVNDHFVDAIGAGDSFNAGFILKYLSGESVKESLRYGNLIGAISTTASGGTTAFESLASFQQARQLFDLTILQS
ncbi:carbohydrate kinase family protein [Pedobacter immunditicola]|uniref:carbohydrate kinase family protein n=1 Tax=Pedobacter immunditicola TaxID=3133440 RepID=UPI00309E0A48